MKTAWKPKANQNPVIHGYRLCTNPRHAGPRWLPVSNFPPQKWKPGKEEPLYFQSSCHACRRLDQRAGSMSHTQLRERQKRDRRYYHDRKDPRFDAADFCHWVNRIVQENSLTGVAFAVGVSARRVSAFAAGSYTKSGRLYQIKRVRRSTVERFCDGMRENIHRIYPDA